MKIRMRGTSKRFDDKIAVDDVDLDIPEKSLYGLIGPNGAGKTTILKMLATLIKPDQGEIAIDDLDLQHHVREVRRTIGYMPDSFGTFRGMSCEEYLHFFARCYGLRGPALTRRTADVLELTDLGPLRADLASSLSLGLRQRLSLAKTLIHDPDILLLDEPASGLDPRARIEIRVFLRELAQMGKTIVISSHILADLEEICTDVAIIEHGKVAWHGALDAVSQADVEAGQILELGVPDDAMNTTRRILAELADVTSVSSNGSRLEIQIQADNTNSVLRTLLAEDIKILHFSRKGANLEELFLSRTKGLGK